MGGFGPLVELAYYISERFSSAAILTDFDDEGERLAKRVGSLLQELGVRVDNSVREQLRSILFRHGLRTIESMTCLSPAYYSRHEPEFPEGLEHIIKPNTRK